jgi:hypothetical protein
MSTTQTDATAGGQAVGPAAGSAPPDADMPMPAELDGYSLRAVKTTALAVVAAVVVGLVPFLYDAYPGLATDEGFWRNSRLGIVILWCVLVAMLVHILTLRQERGSRSRSALIQGIGGAVSRAESAVKGLDEAVDRANSVLGSVTDAVTEVSYLSKMREISRGIESVLNAASASLRVEGRGFPDDCRFLVHLGLPDRDAADTGLWPAFPPERVLDPRTVIDGGPVKALDVERTRQRVLGIATIWNASPKVGDTFRPNDHARAKLHGAERRVQACVSYPIFSEQQVAIGVLTVWSPNASTAERYFHPDRLVDLIDLTEDVAASALEALDLLTLRA